MMRRKNRWFAAALSIALLLFGTAHAQDAAQEDLVQQAFTLIREGKYEDARKAIDQLERVNKMNPKLGLLKELLAAETQGPAADPSAAAQAMAPGSQNEKDEFCLWAAEGNTNGVRELLGKGVDANAKDQFGTAALEHAAEAGHEEIVKLLVGKGADVNLQDPRGNSPLMLAAWNGHIEAVKVLLEAGADVNVRNSAGLTALGIAKGKNREEIEVLLKQKGAQE